MHSVSDITKVIVDDIHNFMYDEDEPKRYMSGNIILGVSNDDKVYHEWFDGIIKREKDGTLFLDNYYGKLLIPRHCGVQILDSNRIISGLVNFPAYLDSYDQINIMIDKESGLELLVSTLGELNLNGKKIHRIIEDKTKKIPVMIGKDFSFYEYKFNKRSSNNSPKLIEDTHGIIADFGNQCNYTPIDICMKYNLVAIDTETGDVNAYYENFDSEGSNQGLGLFKGIRTLEREIELAKRSENYEKAAKLLERLQGLEDKRFLKSVQAIIKQ
jgi:hypothetical protein